MRKYFSVFQFNLKSSMNFKVDYLFSLFSFVIHVFIFNELWDFILKDKVILGYSRPELIWYIIMGEFLMYVVGGKNYKKISDMIKNGDVANMLTKPISFLKYTLAEEMTCIINLVINFVSAMILGTFMAGSLKITFFQMILFFISVLFSTVLLILIQVMIGMLAFITEENDSYYFVISKGMLLLVLTPLEFFPEVFRNILTFLPTTYAIYPVGKILVHFDISNSLKLVVFQLLSIMVMLMIVNLLNVKGVKNINVNGG
ncbi:MAG: ABC-2 family transporter protein [Clostridia bacterium]|nr:ABC-2 family transporter protein [Clostridia bacterium]